MTLSIKVPSHSHPTTIIGVADREVVLPLARHLEARLLEHTHDVVPVFDRDGGDG